MVVSQTSNIFELTNHDAKILSLLMSCEQFFKFSICSNAIKTKRNVIRIFDCVALDCPCTAWFKPERFRPEFVFQKNCIISVTQLVSKPVPTIILIYIFLDKRKWQQRSKVKRLRC